MKYYVKNLLILLLSISVGLLFFTPSTDRIYAFISIALPSHPQPPAGIRPQGFLLMAICDGEPEFVPAMNALGPLAQLQAITSGQHRNHRYTWLQPNCAVAITDVDDVETETISDWRNSYSHDYNDSYSPHTVEPTKLSFMTRSLPDGKAEDRSKIFAAADIPEGYYYSDQVYYYSDHNLSGDFTSDERISTDGFLPEQLHWVVSNDEMMVIAYGYISNDYPAYIKAGGNFIKYADIKDGPFDGQALYMISLHIVD